MHKKGVAISQTISDCKSEKCEKFCASKLLIWRKKWTAGVRHGTSLVVRRVSSGRPIVVSFWTKYAFPRQIKPGILTLITSRGHSNLLVVFSFVNCEGKGYYRVVSVGLPLVLRAQLPYARAWQALEREESQNERGREKVPYCDPPASDLLVLYALVFPLYFRLPRRLPGIRRIQLAFAAFSQTDLFLVWIYRELRPHRNLRNVIISPKE